ncbi:MAG TPA: hypothetical protein DCM05_05525 [Elusimicrobia bacterium]|nr:hypothetical protein [Elusimicrobiota bacterium]
MLDIRWQGAVDFIVLAAAIYVVLHWSREARALRVTLGILMIEVGAQSLVRRPRGRAARTKCPTIGGEFTLADRIKVERGSRASSGRRRCRPAFRA